MQFIATERINPHLLIMHEKLAGMKQHCACLRLLTELKFRQKKNTRSYSTQRFHLSSVLSVVCLLSPNTLFHSFYLLLQHFLTLFLVISNQTPSNNLLFTTLLLLLHLNYPYSPFTPTHS